MQFTVLIEFLIPGLATTLLILALLPPGTIPQPPEGMPTGDTATALLLLAVSYPVGILINFPIYRLQRRLLTPRVHRAVIEKYDKRKVSLSELSTQQISVEHVKYSDPLNRADLRDIFGLLRASVFGKNIDRLNSHHLYHEGLQRLARGLLVPIILAAIWVWIKNNNMRGPLVFSLGLLFLFSLWLLKYSVRAEEEMIVRYFLVAAAKVERKETGAANPGPAEDA